MNRITLSIVLCLLLLGCQMNTKKIQDGDINFHTSTSSQSRAIQASTHSKYSHMGIIYSERE